MPRTAAYFKPKIRSGIVYVHFTRKGTTHFLSTGIGAGEPARAQQEVARLVAEHDAAGTCERCAAASTRAAAAEVSMTKMAEEYQKAIAREHPEAYCDRVATDMSNYIVQRWRHPAEITSTSWAAAMVDLHTTETERRAHLSWGSIANLANTLRAFLRWCAAQGHISSVPEIKSPTQKQKVADRAFLRPLDEDQMQALLWAIALDGDARALRVYLTLFETWMRKSAVEAMTPRWIDWRGESITIPAKHTKSQKADKTIDLTPLAAEAIRAEMATHEAVQLDQPIFGAFDYRSQFWRAVERAGIDVHGLTAHHVTRRTAATIASGKPGASLSGLMAQGGWDSASVPEIYMRPTLKAARAVTRG